VISQTLVVLAIRCPDSVEDDDCQVVLEVTTCSRAPIGKVGDKVQLAIRPRRPREGVEI
jgi:hypothetical protein